jgi:putative ABC transport system permease protein
MFLNFKLAWRNIWRHRRRTWLTAIAMIFSNVLLVFMISLQLGQYDMMINNTVQMFSGHAQVQREGYQETPRIHSSVPGVIGLAQEIRDRQPMSNVAARAAAFALVSSDDRTLGAEILGVQPAYEPQVSTLPGLVSEGRYLQDDLSDEIVIGSVMARNLKVMLGDELTLLGNGKDGSFAAGVVTVVGITNSGSPDMDRAMAAVGLQYFQDVFSMEGAGSSIVIAVETIDETSAVVGSASETIGTLNDSLVAADEKPLVVLDWRTLNPGLEQAIQADFVSAWFMYGVLIILVALSVLNTQLMSVLERTREFGVVMALGIKPRGLASLVVLETILMALLGLFIGVFLGVLVVMYFNSVGVYFPGMEEMAVKYNLPGRMYPSTTASAIFLGPLVVFLFSLLASIYPATRLFRLNPIQAMRST